MNEEKQKETPESKSNKKLAVIIIILLLLSAVVAVVFLFFIKKDDSSIASNNGDRVEIDDFYHAENGTWKMETTIHLLKSQKFVSSKTELKEYLIYTANPGEIVRISQASGRWKKLEVLKNGKVAATGWADAEDGRAELQKDNKTDK